MSKRSTAQHTRRLAVTAATIAGTTAILLAGATTASALPPPGAGGGDGGGTGGGTHTSSCGTQNNQTGQTTVSLFSHDKKEAFVFKVPPCGRVTLSASGSVSDGWWFHGVDGPEGWVGNIAGSDYPLPGDNTGAVIGRFDGASYTHVGRGTTVYNTSPSTTKNYYLFRNDNVTSNGYGSFSVVATLYGS